MTTTSHTRMILRRCRGLALAGLALQLGACDDDAALGGDDAPDLPTEEAAEELAIDEDDGEGMADLGEVWRMPEGSVVHAIVADSEKEAFGEFAEVLHANEISGEFFIEEGDDGIYELVLVEADPWEGKISEDLIADDDGMTPRTSYDHDFYKVSRTGKYGTSVTAWDDQALSWGIVSGKTSRMYGQAKWDSSVDFAYFVVTETWKGVSLSGSIPGGLSGAIGSSYGTYKIWAESIGNNTANVEWCVSGPKGLLFTSRTLQAALGVKRFGKTYMIANDATSWFVPDWTSPFDAC